MQRLLLGLFATLFLCANAFAQTGIFPAGKVPIGRGPGITGFQALRGPIYAEAAPYNAKCDGVTDDTVAIQAAIDAGGGTVGNHVILPNGVCIIGVQTLYLARNNTILQGQGKEITELRYVNTLGGTAIGGARVPATDVISQCQIKDIFINSGYNGSLLTGADIVIDFTSMNYCFFDLLVSTKRDLSTVFYGQGNTGQAPYYNIITGTYQGGATNQTFLRCRSGTATGSNGCNGNIIGPIARAITFQFFADIWAGNGNMFHDLNLEGLGGTGGGAHFRFNSNIAFDSGTSTGSNGNNSLKDTTQTWTTNAFANFAVSITSGLGAGQIRSVSGNSATALTITPVWGVIPDATSVYTLYEGLAHGNQIVNVRSEADVSVNPDFIVANPGTFGSSCVNCSIFSLGSGLVLRDRSGSITNRFFSGSSAVLTREISAPAASTTYDIFPGSGGLGGASLGTYTIDWAFVTMTTPSHGGTAVLTVLSGLTSVLAATMPNGESSAGGLPSETGHTIYTQPLHATVVTDGSFSGAGQTIIVTIGVTLSQ